MIGFETLRQISTVQQAERSRQMTRSSRDPHEDPHIPDCEEDPHSPDCEEDPHSPDSEEDPQSPDCEEDPHGPHCDEEPHSPQCEARQNSSRFNDDDEFFDAVGEQGERGDVRGEHGEEQGEEHGEEHGEEQRDRGQQHDRTGPSGLNEVWCRPSFTFLPPSHPLHAGIERVVREHISSADLTAADVARSWTLVVSEGALRVYRREVTRDGAVVYPLKAVHAVRGITAHELCHYFWNPAVRMEWEATLDSSVVLEWLAPDTHVTYQVLRRVWPAAQRDAVYWSTLRRCAPPAGRDGPEYWIVVNHSTEETPAPLSALPSCIRLQFNVALICQTIVKPPPVSGQAVGRDNLTCRIQYSANVNPMGWVPASFIQIACKREAAKFLKTFTAYVRDKTKDKPIMF